jgi:hypothetical protein
VGYDLARAHILLRDLERVAQGRAPAVEMATTDPAQPPICGDFTRFGLLKLAVQLARAALEAEATVAVHASGRVEPNGRGGLLELHLADDQPPVPGPREQIALGKSGCLALVTLFGLAAVGLVTVVGLLVSLVGTLLS